MCALLVRAAAAAFACRCPPCALRYEFLSFSLAVAIAVAVAVAVDAAVAVASAVRVSSLASRRLPPPAFLVLCLPPRRCCQKAVDAHVGASCLSLEGGTKFKCALCSKLFRAAEPPMKFVAKHVRTKHVAELRRVKHQVCMVPSIARYAGDRCCAPLAAVSLASLSCMLLMRGGQHWQCHCCLRLCCALTPMSTSPLFHSATLSTHTAGGHVARLGSLLGRQPSPLCNGHAPRPPAWWTARRRRTTRRRAAERAWPRAIEACVSGSRRNARPQWAARLRSAERGWGRPRLPRFGTESVNTHTCRLRRL